MTAWPVRPLHSPSEKCVRNFVIEILIIALACIGLGVFFNDFYGRPDPVIFDILLSSALAGVGFIAVVFPCAWYLRTFNLGVTTLAFVVSLALVFILVTSKVALVEIYEDMPSDTPERSLFLAYFSAATLEEIIKVAVYMGPIIFTSRFRTVYDIAFLSVCAGCCFATIENLITAGAGPVAMLQRFLWCTLTHTTDCLTGALIFAHIERTFPLPEWKGLCLLPLVITVPVALHGSYDFVIFVSFDVAESWVAGLSVLIGAISVALAAILFFPFRKSKWPFEHEREDKLVVVQV